MPEAAYGVVYAHLRARPESGHARVRIRRLFYLLHELGQLRVRAAAVQDL